MDHRTLHYIITVAEEGNISKAAQKLHLSQPSLSHCILKQERKLRVAFFDRTHQPLRLTYAGERYVAAAREILDARERLEKEMGDIASDAKGRVAVGVTKAHSACLLPRVLPRFRALYPGIEIALTEENISSLESTLVTDKTEIALLVMPVQSEHLLYERLCGEKILLCLPKRHPLVARCRESGADIALLKDEPLILHKKGMRVRKISDTLFAEANIRPRAAIESEMAATIFNLVSASVGCAFLPESVVRYFNSPRRVEPFTVGDPPVALTLAFAWKRGSYVSRAAQSFMKTVREALDRGDGRTSRTPKAPIAPA
jgi:DNA-binding transcriptional LysR family regulator